MDWVRLVNNEKSYFVRKKALICLEELQKNDVINFMGKGFNDQRFISLVQIFKDNNDSLS